MPEIALTARFLDRFAARWTPWCYLAAIVLLVALRMGVDLFIRPEEIYTVQ